jgi:hypothetical protein
VPPVAVMLAPVVGTIGKFAYTTPVPLFEKHFDDELHQFPIFPEGNEEFAEIPLTVVNVSAEFPFELIEE